MSAGTFERAPITLTAGSIAVLDIARYSFLIASAWIILFVAALFEIGWAIGLEYSDGFTNVIPSIATVVALVVSMLLLARAVQSIPIGTAYAIWTGIGAVGAATLGIVLFNKSASFGRIVFISFIVIGVVGLNAISH